MWWLPIAASAQPALPNRQTLEGMTAHWGRMGSEFHIELDAATSGWLLVGFNDRDDIVGADLKFVRVVDGKAELHDHHVVSVGVHQPDQAPNEGKILSHAQSNGRTRVRLQLPQNPTDIHDFKIPETGRFWMILAWSVSPDLNHHSRVRRHFQIGRPKQP